MKKLTLAILFAIPLFAQEEKKLTEEEALKQIETLQAQLQELEGKLSSCQSELDNIKNEIAPLDEEIKALENEISALKEELTKYPSEYEVKPGDFLAKIAEYPFIYGTYKAWPRIYRANMDKIKDPDLIYPGWILKIPHGLDKTYTVIRGDYLWKIASFWWIYRDGKQWKRIYEANKDKIKDPDLIYPGQILNIPR